MSNVSIPPSLFRQWLEDGQELAVLDLRSIGSFAKGEPLFATNVPAETVLKEIDRYVPRKQVRTVLIDDGDGEAARLARALRDHGRAHVFAVEGGIPAWLERGADLPTFDTSGRDFSVAIQQERRTPVWSVEQLRERREQGEHVILIDTRTLPEYAREHVPGAIGIPAAELLLRFADAVSSPTTQVVVSCAGLPRAILGAQTLIDAGVANPVAYLDDGTTAWRRAGWELEEGAERAYGPVSEKGRAFGRRHADQLSSSGRFPRIDLATARIWANDPDRTTYLLDVRTPKEFEDEHLEGTISSEGGQLFAVSHRTLAVRGARVVLIDDGDGIRADSVAHWLHRRGFEIAILRHAFGAKAATQTHTKQSAFA
jgi:rhodanese-related sulfurtransferase